MYVLLLLPIAIPRVRFLKDVYGSIYAFTADGFSLSQLRDYVERARQEVLRLPNVAKAELIGVHHLPSRRAGRPKATS